MEHSKKQKTDERQNNLSRQKIQENIAIILHGVKHLSDKKRTISNSAWRNEWLAWVKLMPCPL